MDRKKIEGKANSIIEDAEEIKEAVKPKKAEVQGDPIVKLY